MTSHAMTIFSLSSAQGRAGVAIVRVSGTAADTALLALTGRLPAYRVATLLELCDPRSGELLDKALVLRFAEGASFTGEASVEFQIHGSRAVLSAVLDALGSLPDLRLAEAGEFTRRALDNGRLDLGQVEALADLIDADTQMQRRQALRGFEGNLGEAVHQWRAVLLEAKAMVAAEIDFADEGDVGENAAAGIDSLLKQLQEHLQNALASADRGQIITDGLRIALVGAPNVGKSTLLNALAGSDVAIVSEYAGTTRDVLEVRLDLEGYSVIVSDTAGLREAIDPVERIGVERARQTAGKADLLLLLDDGHGDCIVDEAWDGIPILRVRSKSDQALSPLGSYDFAISSRTGAGIDSLKKRILMHLVELEGAEPPLITRLRQRRGVEKALDCCREARDSHLKGIEFVDANLQRLDQALSEIIGLIGVEDVLGAIFSRFCVGK